MSPSNLVVVSTFRTTADALVAQGLLEDAGIESMMRTDDAGGMYPAMGAVALMVREEDAHEANEALSPRHRRSGRSSEPPSRKTEP
jgi:hypothetical protein